VYWSLARPGISKPPLATRFREWAASGAQAPSIVKAANMGSQNVFDGILIVEFDLIQLKQLNPNR
jgi:hypothetical protein